MLCLRTNTTALAATRAADKSSRAAGIAQTRLSTGYPSESAAATSAQMLPQARTAMLWQENSVPSLILSLVQQ